MLGVYKDRCVPEPGEWGRAEEASWRKGWCALVDAERGRYPGPQEELGQKHPSERWLDV